MRGQLLMNRTLRMVDLFCGCGGMSLGFELYKGGLKYQTVMALDNDPIPLRCLNENIQGPAGGIPVGRVCDLTWFGHQSEVLLYYLVHFALWKPDSALLSILDSPKIGFRTFLSHIRMADQTYQERINELVSSPAYNAALSEIDRAVFTLQIGKAFLARLGLSSLATAAPHLEGLPWAQEYGLLTTAEEVTLREWTDVTTDIESSVRSRWNAEMANLEEASNKEGWGQHEVVGRRLRSLVAFLQGKAGKALRRIWARWQAQRISLRATFCSEVHPSLLGLYNEERRVHLVLGGPPCKGFSRVGRAKIESLRNQGAHAWTSKEYGDERNALLHKYVLFLEALHPDAFVFENVANFQSTLRTPAGKLDAPTMLGEAIEELSQGGLQYEVSSAIVRAREHAIPQDRERFIMVGFSCNNVAADASRLFLDLPKEKGEVPLYVALQGLESPVVFSMEATDPSRPNCQSRAYTMIDPKMPASHVKYIEWIRQAKPGASAPPDFVDAHIVRRPRPDDLALIEKFAPGQRWMDYKLRGARTLHDLKKFVADVLTYVREHARADLPKENEILDLAGRVDEGLLLRLILEDVQLPLGLEAPHHLLSSNYLSRGGDAHGDWFERLSAERPCKTIAAHIGKDTYGYIHPHSNRALSIREAARIQSFPDFFSFGSAGIVVGYAMIGNAVPPLLAHKFAEQFSKLHEKVGLFQGRKSAGEEVERRRRVVRKQLDISLH